MAALARLSFFQNHRDEVANQLLARELAASADITGIHEIAENLWNKKNAIRADCIKVMYEIGYIKPELIASYAEDFLKLLVSKENRLVWGAMTALSTIAAIRSDFLFANLHSIYQAMHQGSVITIDKGVKTLAVIASQNPAYQKEIVPYLVELLSICRTKEVPQHAESTLMAISGEFFEPFKQVLEERMKEMSIPQVQRIKRLIKKTGLNLTMQQLL